MIVVKIILVIVAYYVFNAIRFGFMNRKWRRNIKIDDKCFFVNIKFKKTYGFVVKLGKNNMTRLAFRTDDDIDGLMISSGWYYTKTLRIK